MKRIKTALTFLFTWITGLEPGFIKKSDFFHVFRDSRNCYVIDKGYPRHMYQGRAERSWYVGLSILRGAGYCHWLFGRRVSLRGFTIKIGRNLKRYEMKPGRWNMEVFSPFVVEVYRGGNSGHMTAEHGAW